MVIFKKNVSTSTVFSLKFVLFYFIFGFITINFMKLVVIQFPELNQVVIDLLTYGIPAVFVTIFAIWLEEKNSNK